MALLVRDGLSGSESMYAKVKNDLVSCESCRP